MPKIKFIASDGSQYDVETKSGVTVMDAALKNGVPGIEAECGGACACAMCHVHVDKEWMGKAGRPSSMERDMLDFAEGTDETSRLSCQIKMTDELDGLVIHVPEK